MSGRIYLPIVREGFLAAYQGVSAFANPYTAEREAAARRVWFDGWTQGAIARRRDRRDGRNPDVSPRSEFGIISAGATRR